MAGSGYDEGHLSGDLQELVERLRSERAEASALDLDRVKTRAMANAAASRPKGFIVKSRSIAALITVALMAAGTGGVIAASNTGGGGGSSANTQYKPGCGPPPNGVNPSGTHTGPPGLNNGRANCPH